jgi:hypothetical protein
LKGVLSACFLLVWCLGYQSTLKQEAMCSSKTMTDFQQTTWYYIPEDRTLCIHCCENLQSYMCAVRLL